jgi:hypothetical protein
MSAFQERIGPMGNEGEQADRAEILSLLPALYDAVGWDEEKAPDWGRFRLCCHSSAVLVPMGGGAATPMSLDAFIAGMEEQRTSGALGSLSEREIANEATVYGNLAAVRSTFVASIEGADRRGVTFATIVREQGRWLILTAAWENEDPEQPLPNHLL